MADALTPRSRRVCVVSSREDADTHGLPVVRDLYEGRGALGGVHAALARCTARWAFIVSCDLPFVTRELFERLASFRLQDGVEAVAPIQDDGRQQPLCALYAPAPCLTVADELIRADELRPRALLRRMRTRWVA